MGCLCTGVALNGFHIVRVVFTHPAWSKQQQVRNGLHVPSPELSAWLEFGSKKGALSHRCGFHGQKELLNQSDILQAMKLSYFLVNQELTLTLCGGSHLSSLLPKQFKQIHAPQQIVPVLLGCDEKKTTNKRQRRGKHTKPFDLGEHGHCSFLPSWDGHALSLKSSETSEASRLHLEPLSAVARPAPETARKGNEMRGWDHYFETISSCH